MQNAKRKNNLERPLVSVLGLEMGCFGKNYRDEPECVIGKYFSIK